MHHAFPADDSFGGTFAGADAATLALIRQDVKRNQFGTRFGRTPFFIDMRYILFFEVPECGQHRIRGGLPQRAKRTGFNVAAEFFQQGDIFRPAFAAADSF